MHTLLLGRLEIPAKYRKYIAYIQTLQNEGTVYEKSVVDGLIGRFIEIANDNQHIKDLYARKAGMGSMHTLTTERLCAALGRIQETLEYHSPESASPPKEPLSPEYVIATEKAGLSSLAMQALHIREEFSELTAHALSILLIIVEIEDLLKLTTQEALHENICEEEHSPGVEEGAQEEHA
ncbi:hypothetical protein NECID01_1269 [Nematocida sp. AWRm77]|nr:hypothetical protein NECID01_1269 [Nematocida sp. AWRm77]